MDNPARTPILQGMTYSSDLIIVGGGLNGPALALAASQAGLTCTLIDAQLRDTRTDPSFDGR
jgi:2-octaprenyl-6-methoxyphenol hydroxylase